MKKMLFSMKSVQFFDTFGLSTLQKKQGLYTTHNMEATLSGSLHHI